jgi:hypothetical protein
MPPSAPPRRARRTASRPICAQAAATLSGALARILEAFALFVFARYHVIGAATGSPLHRRIQRATRRLQRLLALAAQGREPRRYTHRPRPARARASTATPLPRRYGWGCDLFGYQGNAFGHQLHTLLNRPETTALLRAAPARTRLAAARAVRPLLHMFARPMPDVLQPAGPPRPRRRRPRPGTRLHWPGGRRPYTHPYPMLPGDPPLRPYVVRAARAWKRPATA